MKNVRFQPTTIILGILMLAVFKRLCTKMYDFDLWWQLASGREMVERGVLLRNDIFSHTFFGAEWINFEWLGQIFLYLLYAKAGMSGIFFAKVFLSLSVLALLAWCCRAQGARGPYLVLLTWLGFMILRPRLMERLELTTLNLLAFYALALNAAKNAGPAGRRLIPYALFLLMVLWCNLHAGFIYGIGMAVLLDWGARWAGKDAQYVRTLDRTVALLLCAALINPYGAKLFTVFMEHIFQLGGGSSLITEWRPPAIADLPYFWALFVLSNAAVLWGILRGRAEARFWAPAVVTFSAWGGLSHRNSALLAFVALPFLARLCVERSTGKGGGGPEAGILWLACAAALLPLSTGLTKEIPKDPVYWNLFPRRACQFVEDRGLSGNMFNAYDFGGYIQWALGPQRKVFIDGRYLFYPLLIEDAALTLSLSDGLKANRWPEYLKKHDISYAIMNYQEAYFRYPKTPFPLSLIGQMFPRSDWALVFWDDTALVFVRRAAGNAGVIKEFEFRSLWPYNLEQMSYLIASGDVDPRSVRRDLLRHKRSVGFTVLGREIEKMLHGQGGTGTSI